MSFVGSRKKKALKERMEKLGIFESDLEERFIKSGKPGGQNVNKVSTCVYLKHIPTGIEVKCQKERSQALNRYLARKILVEKIEELLRGKDSEKWRKIERIRKNKRKRAKRAKEKKLKKMETIVEEMGAENPNPNSYQGP
ncbi:MAG: peptide chain release factor-like protein [Deltaproteobacteria bacterium]|nr:peptide chain release factor-like protein [Deltaproteobacteria bacterium]